METASNGDIIQVGPQSVGYRIFEEGLLFGGSTPRQPMCVGLGIAEIGDAAPARQYGEKLLREVKGRIDSMIINAVERMRVSPEKNTGSGCWGRIYLDPRKGWRFTCNKTRKLRCR